MKHKLGIFLMLAGTLAIAAAVGMLFWNQKQDVRAGQASAQVLTQIEEAILEKKEEILHPALPEPEASSPDSTESEATEQTVTLEMPVREIDGYEYVGYLSIPSIQRKLPVMAELNNSHLRRAPCRYYGSAYTDDLVIAAHNFDSHFGPLPELTYGDRVYFTDMDGLVSTYAVEEIEILHPEEIDKMIHGSGDLVLFTCNVGVPARLTIRCNRIGNP